MNQTSHPSAADTAQNDTRDLPVALLTYDGRELWRGMFSQWLVSRAPHVPLAESGVMLKIIGSGGRVCMPDPNGCENYLVQAAPLMPNLTAEQLQSAREWLSDNHWADMEPEDFPFITDEDVVRGIARHYKGGLEAFRTGNTEPEEAAQHSPGPWNVEVWNFPRATPPRKELVIRGDRLRLATVAWDQGVPNPFNVEDATARANARLMVAAPNLYDLLKAAALRVQLANREGDPILSAWLPDALAEIARVEGRGQ
jgi:hypothetical protein